MPREAALRLLRPVPDDPLVPAPRESAHLPLLDMSATLDLVARTIVESLGFDVAVINVVQNGALVVAAVCGGEDVKAALLHRRQSREAWAMLLQHSEPRGRLRFLDHRTSGALPSDLLTWVPDLPTSEDPSAWHSLDALLAPLEGSDGSLLGMLSVDVPRDGMRPSAATCQALEAFAVAASLALEHAALAASSQVGLRQFQAIFDTSPVAIGVLDEDRVVVSANQALCAFLDRPPEHLVGHHLREFSHPDEDERPSLPTEPTEHRYLLPDGGVAWGRLHLASLDGGDGLVLAQLEDLTEHRRTEVQREQQANDDALTGLPNRPHAMRALRSALDADTAAGTLTAVLFCDVDRLKQVNDVHGHVTGDAYLLAVSERIRASVRDTDIVGRLSGDEFLVVLSGLRWPAEAIGLAGHVIDAVRRPLTLGGTTFSPSLSLGIAYHDAALTADELVARAATAMTWAKTAERGSWHVYDTSLKGTSAAHLALRNDLPAALARDEFVLHYQPIVRLADGTVTGHEALLRWQHPIQGLLSPATFLDVIVDSEFESAVTDWVLRRACHDAASRPAGARRVNVNVSSLQVGRRDLPEVIRHCLGDAGLHPSDLVLELTEDRLLARPDGAHLIESLQDLGVALAIDDFGTGFAGLGYLQRFSAIRIVKLDQSFIRGLGRDPVSEHIVSAVVDLARKCPFRLVTEGVETTEQADLLRHLGVEYAQGYLFGRPVPYVRPE